MVTQNWCARKEQSRLFDLYKAFDKIESSQPSNIFFIKDQLSNPVPNHYSNVKIIHPQLGANPIFLYILIHYNLENKH